jgi:hypothetical protein
MARNVQIESAQPTTSTNPHPLGDYKNLLNVNGVRSEHQFMIEFSLIDPQGGNVNTGLAEIANQLRDYVIYAKTASIPGRNTVSQKLPFYGMNFNVPMNLEYDTQWSLDFTLDTQLNNRRIMEAWADTVADLRSNTGGSKGRLPLSKAYCHLLDSDLTTVIDTYTLEGVFPKKVGQIKLAHESNNVANFAVELEFSYWYHGNSDPLA